MKMKVSNLESSRGNTVPNQFVIRTEEGRFFQSYDSIICFIPYEGKVLLDAKTWNYSRTTSKYRSQFLGEGTKETEKKIDDGTYILTNLN
jgi:hypothetical protein